MVTCLLPVSGWLKDKDHELIRRVSLRIEDVTGLTMDTAEELQVCTVRGGVRKNIHTAEKGSILLLIGFHLIVTKKREETFKTPNCSAIFKKCKND